MPAVHQPDPAAEAFARSAREALLGGGEVERLALSTSGQTQ